MSVSTFSPSSTNTESSLNLHNLNTALETLPDDEWYVFGAWLNVPRSQRDEIRSQYSTERERKSALLHTYLTSYPAPSWQHVADTLYRYIGGKFHAVLERVQTMFPTGKKMYQCCVAVLFLTIDILVYGLFIGVWRKVLIRTCGHHSANCGFTLCANNPLSKPRILHGCVHVCPVLYVDHLVTLYGSWHIHVHKQTACM